MICQGADLAAVRARVFDGVADALVIVDDEYQLVDANLAALKLFGLALEALIGKRLEEIAGVRDNDPSSRGTQHRSRSLRFKLQRGDGSTTLTEGYSNADIAPGLHLWVLRDITALQRDVERLTEELSEAKRARAVLEALVDKAPIGIAMLDPHLRFQFVNSRLAEMSGLETPECAPQPRATRLPGIPTQRLREIAHEIERAALPELNYELRHEAHDASGEHRVWVERWFSVNVRNAVVAMGVVVDDITQQRRREEERERQETFRELFVPMLAHDLRSPLSAILSGALLLRARGDLTPRDTGTVERLESAALRMTRMIEQLLDFTRARVGGGIAIVPVAMDLAELATELIEEIAASKHVRVLFEVSGSTRGYWDSDRLGQVLSNLLHNAVDHGAGSPVELAIHGVEERVHVRIHNGGPPIPAGLLDLVFEPFRRSESGRSQGLGLGLFIARAIVAAHGGSIEVTSSSAHGTAFEVTLPRVAPR